MIFKKEKIIPAVVCLCLMLTLALGPVQTHNKVGYDDNMQDSLVVDSLDKKEIIVSSATEDIYIDSPVWVKTYGPNYQFNHIRDLIETSDGGFCLLGEMGNPDDSLWISDAILLKTDSDGNQIWNQTYGRSDNVYEPTWDLIECSNGDFVFVGMQHQLSGSILEGWLVRTNSTGHLKFNITYPKPRYLVSVSELSNGDLFICGLLQYSTGIYFMRTDENGTIQWDFSWELHLNTVIAGVVEYSPGDFVIGGYAYSGSPDVHIPFLFRVTQDMSWPWANHYTLNGDVRCESILKLDSGDILMTGSADGGLWFCEVDPDGEIIREVRNPNVPYFSDEIKYLNDGTLAIITNFFDLVLLDDDYNPRFMIPLDIGSYGTFIQVSNNELLIGGAQFSSGNYTLSLFREPWLSWNESISDIIVEYLQPLHHDFNATCSQSIDGWTVNATGFFDIDSNGILTNNSVLGVGVYPVKVAVNDTLENALYQDFLVIVEDTTSPEWIHNPEEQQIELGSDFNYDLDAFDPSGIDEWTLNSTCLFDISAIGVITNRMSLEVGTYGLMVTVADVYGNELSGEFSLTVSDTISPEWVIAPSDKTLTEGQDIELYLAASDLSGIGVWTCNDTVNFEIAVDTIHDAGSCQLANQVALDVGTYGLNLTVTDIFGNALSTTFTITVEEAPVVTTPTTTPTTTSPTTTPQPTQQPQDMVMLIAAGSGWGVAILVAVVLLKRRS